MDLNTTETLEAIEAVCKAADVTVALHVRALDGSREMGITPDAPSVTASTYKIAVMLEVAAQSHEEKLDLVDRVKIPAGERTLGPSGISSMCDDIELSVRDLALLMMQVSDNTATDVLQKMVGTEAINDRLRGLGLNATTVRDDCQGILDEVLHDLSLGAWPGDRDAKGRNRGNPFQLEPHVLQQVVRDSDSLNARSGNTSTPRDMTRLVSLIWNDEAAAPEACAEVRRIMGQQYAPHRLSSAYGDGPAISGKTGSFFGGVRNEVGVVDFGDGDAYAVAVFLRNSNLAMRNAAADGAIGSIAALAIDSLRAETVESK